MKYLNAKEKIIEIAKNIVKNAEIDDNIADAVLIEVFAAKTLRNGEVEKTD